MKRNLLAVLLSALLLLSAAGCASTGAQTSSPPSSGQPAASNPPETGAGPVKIATKPMTEQRILGQMLSLLITAKTGYSVEVTPDIGGGTSNIQPAMEKGEFDLYPEYTSTGWLVVLKHQAGEVSDADMLAALQKEYQEKYGMTWVGLYGFNNTYTVAVRNAVAEEYGLKTCSDLAKVSGNLVFGGNPDYLEREDGFNAMSAAYGFQFKKVVDIDIGLKYQAMASGDIDATNAYTTDAQLAAADVTTLADDLGYQVNYYCSTVVRQDALTKYPGLEDALKLMDGILSDEEMRKLNYAVEVDGKDEQAAARDYLVSKGLLEA